MREEFPWQSFHDRPTPDPGPPSFQIPKPTCQRFESRCGSRVCASAAELQEADDDVIREGNHKVHLPVTNIRADKHLTSGQRYLPCRHKPHFSQRPGFPFLPPTRQASVSHTLRPHSGRVMRESTGCSAKWENCAR